MKKNRIQVILSDSVLEQFKDEAIKQGSTESALARKYITAGVKSDKTESKNK